MGLDDTTPFRDLGGQAISADANDASSTAHDVTQRFPGHLRAQGPLAYVALVLLLGEYDRNETFAEDCRRIQAVHMNEVSRASMGDSRAARRIAEPIDALAKRWNIQRIPPLPERRYLRLIQAIDQSGRPIGDHLGTPFSPNSIAIGGAVPHEPQIVHGEKRWDWKLLGGEELGSVRHRIIADLDLRRPSELPLAIRRRLTALPREAEKFGWVLGDRQHKLRRHVRWLYLRLCPQPNQPFGYAEIAALEPEGAFVDVRMIRRSVQNLAARMDIDLPPLRPGRPRSRSRPTAQASR